MAPILRILLVALAIIFFVYVLTMVKKGRFLLKYSLLWILLAILVIVAALCPPLVSWLSGVIGIEVPSNFIFLICILVFGGMIMMLCAVASKQTLQIKDLVQEVSLLKHELETKDKRN